MKKPGKTLGISTLAIILIICIVALVVKFEYKIKGPGRFIAKVEWTLVQIEQDKLQSNLIFHGERRNDQVYLFHFDRPDYVHLSLTPNIVIGQKIQAGEVTARFISTEDKIRLAALQGELKEAGASLAAFNTGAKEAYQKQVEEALQYAKAELAAFEPVLERQKVLFEKQLISEQELETAQAQYDLYKINVSLQEARLQTAKTGAKAEQIAVIQAKVAAVAQQLEIFNEKLDAESIKCPINGTIVRPNRSTGELVHVCGLDTMVVEMPVKASEIKYVKPGMKLTAYVSGSEENVIKTKVSSVDRNATFINLQPMYLITALVANDGDDIYNGMTGYMEISTGKTSVPEILGRAWAEFHFNK